MSADYVSAEEWASWEVERLAANKAYDAERHAKTVRERPQLIERLREQIADLEVRAFWAEELLAAAIEQLEQPRHLKVAA